MYWNQFYESLGMAVKNMKFEQSLNDDSMEIKNIDLKVTKRVNK